MFFSENENNNVKMIIPSNRANHFAIAVSVQMVAIRLFFTLSSPNQRNLAKEPVFLIHHSELHSEFSEILK